MIPIVLALAGATAQPQPAVPANAAIDAIDACRTIADEKGRLVCFDRAAVALSGARARNDIVVMDRAEIRRARRGLFGLNLPDFSLFRKRGDGPDDPEIREIETTLARASFANSNWTFVLADGARWRQTDALRLFDPKVGDKVQIRAAALGSYFLKVGNQRSVRAQRIN